MNNGISSILKPEMFTREMGLNVDTPMHGFPSTSSEFNSVDVKSVATYLQAEGYNFRIP